MASNYVFVDDTEVKEILGKKISKIEERLNNIKGGKKEKEWIGSLSAIIFKDVQKHFEQEQGSKGPWKDFSESYKSAIRGEVFFRTINGKRIVINSANVENPPPPPRKGKIGQLLQDTGRLKNSFKPSDYKIQSNGIFWFNNAQTANGFPYAFAHNEGGKQLPKRDFMWLSNEALEGVAKATLDYVGLADEGL